jgi:creatinine amidohydrolase
MTGGRQRLGGRTWPEVAAGRGDGPAGVLLVPLGATEQHGPHLPLATDTCVARAVCDGAAGRLEAAVVAPALPYGSSGEHDAFPGTLSIGADVTEQLLVELGRSASATFGLVVLVSTHGGNAGPVARAVRTLRAERRPVIAWAPSHSRPGSGPPDAHAGRTETALLLAITPDLVRSAQAAPGDLRPLVEVLPVLQRHGVRAVSPNGVLGDPTGATAEEGRELLAAAVGELERFVAEAAGGAGTPPTAAEGVARSTGVRP